MQQANGDVGANGHRARFPAVWANEQERESVWPSPTICMAIIAKEPALNPTHAKCRPVIVSVRRSHAAQTNRKRNINFSSFSWLFNLTAFLGWSTWSKWSECNEDGERVRYRTCMTTDPDQKECQGNERDIRECQPEMANGKSICANTSVSSN